MFGHHRPSWYLLSAHTSLESTVTRLDRGVSRLPPFWGGPRRARRGPRRARIRSACPGTLQRRSQRLHVLYYDPARWPRSHQAICRRHTCELYATSSILALTPPGDLHTSPRPSDELYRTKLIRSYQNLLKTFSLFSWLLCTSPCTRALT